MSTGKGNQIREFAERINGMAKSHVKVQTSWAKATEIDWENKTMTAQGITDDLPYYEISLGLGAIARKPKIGSMCLIGMVENMEASNFLIDAEIIDEYTLKVTDKISIQNEEESLKELMEELLEEIGKMKFTTNAGPTIKLLNKPMFDSIKDRFNKLLK